MNQSLTGLKSNRIRGFDYTQPSTKVVASAKGWDYSEAHVLWAFPIGDHICEAQVF